MAQEIKAINLPWSEEFSLSLAKSALAGKGVRGSLILLTLDLFKKPISNDAIKVAASLEYLHTALLVQDDIMDHDQWRRGLPTSHIEYQELGKKLKVADPADFGKSMAICIADIAIFFGQWFLSKLKDLDLKTKNQLWSVINKEFLLVGFGQAQDLVFAHLKKSPSAKEVLLMYNYKTARYTFSLPLILGGILAKQNKEAIAYLDQIGKSLGLIFQLTDDSLTLSGQANKVGKAIGNDIAENKKTLYHVLLKERADRKDLKIINNIFGVKPVTKKKIKIIKDLISVYNIDKEINSLIKKEEKRAKQIINRLTINYLAKEKLFYLINSLITREK